MLTRNAFGTSAYRTQKSQFYFGLQTMPLHTLYFSSKNVSVLFRIWISLGRSISVSVPLSATRKTSDFAKKNVTYERNRAHPVFEESAVFICFERELNIYHLAYVMDIIFYGPQGFASRCRQMDALLHNSADKHIMATSQTISC